MTQKPTGGLVHESIYCLYFTGRGPIWIKRDVCKQELIIAETYTSFNHNNTQTLLLLLLLLLYRPYIYIYIYNFNHNCTIDVNTNECLL